jgi:archaellum component FlaC
MMFVKDSWEVGDKIVVNSKHGTIKEFSSDNKKVYVEHRDNENQPYVRWYDKAELPAYPNEATEPIPPVFEKGQKVRLTRDLPDTTTTVHPVHFYKGDEGIVTDYFGHLGFHRQDGQTAFSRLIDGVKRNVLDFCELIPPSPTLPHSDGEGSKKEEAKSEEKPAQTFIAGITVDELPDDIALLKEIIREQRRKLNNQAISINAMMDAASDEGKDNNLADKLEQLEDDYKVLKKERDAIAAERDKLAEVNKQQSEMLKNANDVLDAFRIISNFLRLDRVVAPKLEAVNVQPAQ